MSNPSQLFLLSDHIKLSLLERQRAISLNLDPNPTQEAQISRSLESFREGIDALSQRSSDTESISRLRSQYKDLSRQFHGNSSSTAEDILSSPNDPTLQDDFTRAQSRPSTENPRLNPTTRTSNLKSHAQLSQSQKNVRFRDNPSSESPPDPQADANRAALFPQRYTDEDAEEPPDPTSNMDNQQIHAYHSQVIAEQDTQLDSLSESIGRQRQMSMQIGDELEGQVTLLDEVDRGVDRHQDRLDGAKRRLKAVGNTASRNWGMTTIVILIVILLLLILLLK